MKRPMWLCTSQEVRCTLLPTRPLHQEKDRKRTEQSFFVPVQEIIDNGYDLSINKYKEVVYEKVEYEPTDVILGKINALETEIQSELKELQKLLAD